MKCDELKVYVPQDGPYGLEPEEGGKLVEEETCYLKSDVDAAIAELEKLNHELCERVTENDEIRLHWEEIEQTRAENERMKARIAELENENAELKEQYRDMDVTHPVQIAKMNGYIHHLEEERRWRKFPDEKPEKREVVFVRMSDGFYRIAMYLARGLGWDIGDGAHHKSKEVTHWMPVPSAPKEEK